MKFGVLEPHRFGERVEDGLEKYDAITYLHFVGDEATATGLVDVPTFGQARELRDKLKRNGVNRFMYYSKGRKVIWKL